MKSIKEIDNDEELNSQDGVSSIQVFKMKIGGIQADVKKFKEEIEWLSKRMFSMEGNIQINVATQQRNKRKISQNEKKIGFFEDSFEKMNSSLVKVQQDIVQTTQLSTLLYDTLNSKLGVVATYPGGLLKRGSKIQKSEEF